MNGIFLGRMCPIHLGHERTINRMIEMCGIDNCLILLGSSNTKTSIRNFFSYKERRQFFKSIYPTIPVVGIPDYYNDDEWMIAIDDIIESSHLMKSDITTFFGGCKQDIEFFINNNRKIYIVNRFDGSSPKISSTEVRDCLIGGRSLDGLVNPIIIDDVIKVFQNKWEKFKNI